MTTGIHEGPDLAAAIARSRATVRDRVLAVRKVSEQEVLAVGTAVQAIVSQSQKALANVSDSMDRIGDKNESVRAQVLELRAHITEQDQTVERAMDRTTDIAKAGAAIKAMAAASRLLALNARVEAARLDSEHRVAFGVIADEMRELAKEVEAANRSVGQLAAELLKVLPQIRKQSQAMQTQFESLHQEMEQKNTGLNQTFGETLSGTDQAVQEIKRLAYDALSHLQFQDPMVQNLDRIDSVLLELEHLSNGGVAGVVPASTTPAIPVAAADEPEAGHVLLF
jgi:methyl-accepting chemotaxis protein